MKWPQVTINVPDSAGKLQPYLTRIYLWLRDWKWLSLFLHHFHSDDALEHFHDHPWAWGISIVLRGGYVEEYQDGDGVIHCHALLPGYWNVVRSRRFHRVELIDKQKGAWTLFLAGPRIKRWGFWNRETGEYTDFETNPNAIP